MWFAIGLLIGIILGMIGMMVFCAIQISQRKVPRGLRHFLELKSRTREVLYGACKAILDPNYDEELAEIRVRQAVEEAEKAVKIETE